MSYAALEVEDLDSSSSSSGFDVEVGPTSRHGRKMRQSLSASSSISRVSWKDVEDDKVFQKQQRRLILASVTGFLMLVAAFCFKDNQTALSDTPYGTVATPRFGGKNSSSSAVGNAVWQSAMEDVYNKDFDQFNETLPQSASDLDSSGVAPSGESSGDPESSLITRADDSVNHEELDELVPADGDAMGTYEEVVEDRTELEVSRIENESHSP